jgi:uncharacterized protein YybS (DUF2232 family)
VDVNGKVDASLDHFESLPLRLPLTRGHLLLGVTATLLAFLGVLLVPFAGLFAGLFTPLPTLLSIYRFGHPVGFWVPGSVLALGLPLLVWLGAVADAPYLLAMLLMGALLGEGMRHQWSVGRTIGIAVGAALLVGAVAFGFATGGFSPQFWSSLEQEMQQNVTAVLQTYHHAGLGFDQQAALEAIPKTIPIFVRMLPGATLVSLVLVGWLNILVACRFCVVRRLPLPAWAPWPHWKAPEPLVWVVIAAGCMLLLPSRPLALVGANLFLGVSIIYLLQGFAIAVFYLHRWNVPRLLRGIIFALLLLQPLATLLLLLVGLFDMWFNFRRLPPSGVRPDVPETS